MEDCGLRRRMILLPSCSSHITHVWSFLWQRKTMATQDLTHAKYNEAAKNHIPCSQSNLTLDTSNTPLSQCTTVTSYNETTSTTRHHGNECIIPRPAHTYIASRPAFTNFVYFFADAETFNFTREVSKIPRNGSISDGILFEEN